jgi:hypothetical protein
VVGAAAIVSDTKLLPSYRSLYCTSTVVQLLAKEAAFSFD